MKTILALILLALTLAACQWSDAPYDTGCAFNPEIGKCPLSSGGGGGGM